LRDERTARAGAGGSPPGKPHHAMPLHFSEGIIKAINLIKAFIALSKIFKILSCIHVNVRA
jgi:hypothetical protein